VRLQKAGDAGDIVAVQVRHATTRIEIADDGCQAGRVDLELCLSVYVEDLDHCHAIDPETLKDQYVIDTDTGTNTIVRLLIRVDLAYRHKLSPRQNKDLGGAGCQQASTVFRFGLERHPAVRFLSGHDAPTR
jgi:hypothetical protein